MTDPPATIAVLTQALSDAIARVDDAGSTRQRGARTNRAMKAALTLHERLGGLRAWLDDSGADAPFETYTANLRKYEQGWDALRAAEPLIPCWIQDHYVHEDDYGPGRDRIGRRPDHHRRAEAATLGGGAVSKTDVDGAAVARASGDGLTQSALLSI